MCFTTYIFLIKICWNFFSFFCNFITRNYWIVDNTCQIFSVFATTYSRISNIIFSNTRCFLKWHRNLLLFHFWSELDFLLSNLNLHLHDIIFVKIFYSFFSAIISKTCIFKSFVLFGIHTHLEHLSHWEY